MAKTTNPKKSATSEAKAKASAKAKKAPEKSAKAASKTGAKKSGKSAAKPAAKSAAKTGTKTAVKKSAKSEAKAKASTKAKEPAKAASSKVAAKSASKLLTTKKAVSKSTSPKTGAKTGAKAAHPKSAAGKASSKKSKSSRFRVNQKIVYPSQGVGKIIAINDRLFNGEMVPYYNIYIEASDMTVMARVEYAEELGIRAIVSASEAEKALNLLSDDFEPITSDWKLRYQMNLDLLKKGSINDIATIVRCLYNRSKVKELPILERKLYDSARKLLEDEISFATGKSLKEVETLIHIKLEPPGSAPKIKHVINIDDDEDDNLMDDMNTGSNESDDGDSSGDDDSSYDDDSF